MNKQIASAVALALGLGMGSAQAATVSQLVNSYGEFQWEDDNGELVVNNNGGIATQLDVGDYLTGVIEITKILQLNAPFNSALFDGATNSHLSGVFTTQVIGKVANGTGWDFTFAAVGGGNGTIVSFYEAATDNLNILGCATDAACKAAVTDGTLILELGFTGDVDEFWFAEGVPTDNLAALDAAGPSEKFGFANFALGVSGVNLLGDFLTDRDTTSVEPGAADGDNKVAWLNSTDILGGRNSTAYQATSDADFVANSVPEPGSLALVGLGLMGLGFASKRRKS